MMHKLMDEGKWEMNGSGWFIISFFNGVVTLNPLNIPRGVLACILVLDNSRFLWVLFPSLYVPRTCVIAVKDKMA